MSACLPARCASHGESGLQPEIPNATNALTYMRAQKQHGKCGRAITLHALAINRFPAEGNADPHPFRWTKDPDKIIAAVRRGHQASDFIHSHVRHFKLQA